MMSWFLVSMFFQMTRCPTVTVVGLGANELLPLIPTMLIVASARGVGVGVDGVELPQPTASTATATRGISDMDRMVIYGSGGNRDTSEAAAESPVISANRRSSWRVAITADVSSRVSRNGPSTPGVVARPLLGRPVNPRLSLVGTEALDLRIRIVPSTKIVHMVNRQEAPLRTETIAVLDAVELAVVAFSEIFQEVAAGTPLDPQRAENLAAQCGELLKQIAEIRNTTQLSATATGVY